MRYALVRRYFPSVALLTYNPVFRYAGDLVARILEAPFPEARRLPPNHLRARIGVGNKLVNNLVYHSTAGAKCWLQWLSEGLCTPNSDVLEIGCGCGRIALPLEESWFRGTYVGVDIDAETIDYCRRRFAFPKFSFALAAQNSDTYRVGGTSARIRSIAPDASKDFVFGVSLLTHLLEPEVREYASQSFRVLRPGGSLYMTFFCIDSVQPDSRWSFRHQIGKAHVENLRHPAAAVAYDSDFIGEVFQASGFNSVQLALYPGQSVIVAKR